MPRVQKSQMMTKSIGLYEQNSHEVGSHNALLFYIIKQTSNLF